MADVISITRHTLLKYFGETDDDYHTFWEQDEIEVLEGRDGCLCYGLLVSHLLRLNWMLAWIPCLLDFIVDPGQRQEVLEDECKK